MSTPSRIRRPHPPDPSSRFLFTRPVHIGLAGWLLIVAAGVLTVFPKGDVPIPPPGRLALKTYAPEQGLANPVVWSIAQDSRGFMWFATEDGLFRYDGSRFRGWTLADGLPNSLVEHIRIDSEDTVWVGTYSGLASRDARGIQVHGPDQGLPAARITGLALEPSGCLWVSAGDTPYRRTPTGRFEKVPDWPGGIPTALATESNRIRVWVAFSDQGQHGIRSWEEGQWREYPSTPAIGEAVEALASGRSGTIWARSQNHLWELANDQQVFRTITPDLAPAIQKPALYVDPDQRLWVPTSQGISVFHTGTRMDMSDDQGFPPLVVHALFMDREGSLWVGGNDLRRVLGGGIFRHYSTAHGLPSDVVWITLRDREGRLLVGTDAGLCLATSKGFQVIPGTHGFQVRSAQQGPDGAVYATGHPALIRWDPQSGTTRRYGPESGFQPAGRVFRLRFGPDDSLWIATEGSGLIRTTFTNGQPSFESVAIPGGDARERFTDICVDSRQRVWAAGAQGLAVLEDGVWRRFTQADGLKKDQTAFVRPRADGSLLVAYFGAPSLTNVQYENGHFEVVRGFDDIFPKNRVTYFFGEDTDGGLWVGTGQGAYLLQADGKLDHFTRTDGLASENCSNMSFFAEPNGTVWFGTTGGLHRFDANLYKGVTDPPRTSLLEILFGDSVLSGEALPEQMAIPAEANTVEFRFAAPSSIREGAVEYQARLVGFENSWHTSPNREVRYPRLPAGTYRFEARARIGLGEYGPPAAWSFEVLPPWHQSLWFRALIGLSLVGGVLLGVRWRLGALRRRNRILENTVAARTDELHQANEKLRNLSLTDPLTGLRNRRYLDVCMPEDLAQVHRRHTELQNGMKDRMTMNVDMMFLLVDLDHFKTVNDQYGHQAGDAVLQQAAAIIRRATRDTDTLVRWGGEEFLVVARNTCRKEADILAERIRRAIDGHVFDLGNGQTIQRTCSVGFAFYPLCFDQSDKLDWESVLNLADRCLYAAKSSGRNAWVGILCGHRLDPGDLSARLQHDIESFIANGQLRVVTSLKANMKTMRW